MKTASEYPLRKMLLALLSSLLLCVSVGAQTQPEFLQEDGRWNNGVSEAWWFVESLPKEEVKELIARWEKIGQENQNSPGNEWTGDYFTGSDTHGEYLRWSPESGFVIINVNKCSAQVEGFSYGKVARLPTINQFIPDKVVSSSHGHGHGESAPTTINFVPVKLRKARLLISEAQMPGFGDYVAGLGMFNGPHSIYYVDVTPFFFQFSKESGDKKDVGVFVPPGYEKFLKKPVEALIVKVNKRVVKSQFSYENPSGVGSVTYYDPVSITTVTVNVGRTDKVKRGLILKIAETGEELIITRPGVSTSIGIIIRNLDESGREAFHEGEIEGVYPGVETGWSLTTSPF